MRATLNWLKLPGDKEQMKTLLFDLFFAQPLDGSKFHGGGEYIKRVFRELVKTRAQNIRIIVYYNFDVFLDDWIKDIITDYSIDAVDIRSLTEFGEIFDKYHVDIFFTGMPYHYRSEMFPPSVYKIGTLHGMRAVECPHDFYEYKYIDPLKFRLKEKLRNFLKESSRLGYKKNICDGIKNYAECLDCFDKVITDSEHSKYSILNYFSSIAAEDILVLYAPLKERNVRKVNDLHDKKNNLLLLGGNRWIKNAYRGIIAIDDLYSRGHLQNIDTTILGGISKQIKKDIGNPERFHELGYVEDVELEALYNSSILVYPTLNEGFGYPPLEAMYYGSTCIVSAVCSLTEICGDAVYYVNPTDIGEIQNRILQAIAKPIPQDKVISQYKTIRNRQEEDLQKLCNIICGDI